MRTELVCGGSSLKRILRHVSHVGYGGCVRHDDLSSFCVSLPLPCLHRHSFSSEINRNVTGNYFFSVNTIFNARKQNWRKAMFSQVSVCPRGIAPLLPQGHIPIQVLIPLPGSSSRTMPTPRQAACILMECCLVHHNLSEEGQSIYGKYLDYMDCCGSHDE